MGANVSCFCCRLCLVSVSFLAVNNAGAAMTKNLLLLYSMTGSGLGLVLGLGLGLRTAAQYGHTSSLSHCYPVVSTVTSHLHVIFASGRIVLFEKIRLF